MIGLSRPETIEIENMYNIFQNAEGQMLFNIKTREGDVSLPELFYAGGNNALLRRRMDQYILLDEIHIEARECLNKIDEVIITEFIPKTKKNAADNNKGVIKEYKVPVRHIADTCSLDSVEDIREDGYLLHAYLATLVRAQIVKGLKISEIINKEDFGNLAAIFAREEDYELLEKYINEGLPLNKWTSFYFKKWRPTPLFYITVSSVWQTMNDPQKMLNFLVKHGADPNMKSGEEDTPLSNQCLKNGKPEILKALLEAGADPNLPAGTPQGIEAMPLLFALCSEDYDEETKTSKPLTSLQIEKVKLLVEAGADVNAITGVGETPLGMAITFSAEEDRQELITLLIKKGADLNKALEGLEKCIEEGFNEYEKAKALLKEWETKHPCLDG